MAIDYALSLNQLATLGTILRSLGFCEANVQQDVFRR